MIVTDAWLPALPPVPITMGRQAKISGASLASYVFKIRAVKVALIIKISNHGILCTYILKTLVSKYGLSDGVTELIKEISSVASSVNTFKASSIVTMPTSLFSLSTTGTASKPYFESIFAVSSLSVCVLTYIKFVNIKVWISSFISCISKDFTVTTPSNSLVSSIT